MDWKANIFLFVSGDLWVSGLKMGSSLSSCSLEERNQTHDQAGCWWGQREDCWAGGGDVSSVITASWKEMHFIGFWGLRDKELQGFWEQSSLTRPPHRCCYTGSKDRNYYLRIETSLPNSHCHLREMCRGLWISCRPKMPVGHIGVTKMKLICLVLGFSSSLLEFS